MAIIDARVHAYERHHPGRPSADVLHGPPAATRDQMIEGMAAVGVDGAILVSPSTMDGFDGRYAVEVGAAARAYGWPPG